MDIEKIVRPTLVLNKDRAIRNIERMSRKAEANGIRFRPHFKTHQSGEVGSWFRSFDVTSIATSSVSMAESFHRSGWKDIMVAAPVNPREMEHIQTLAERTSLHLIVDSLVSLRALNESLISSATIWIKIDVGFARAGISWKNVRVVSKMIRQLTSSRYFQFGGFLVYSGNSYACRSIPEIIDVHESTLGKAAALRDALAGEYSRIPLSIGDTPSCSVAEAFPGVDEIRPGVFIFYDAMQWNIGACSESDIAAVVVCPVVGKYRRRKELLLYGGAVHLSKDMIIDQRGRSSFGYVAPFTGNGWDTAFRHSYISRLSQELATVHAEDELFNRTKIGDLLAVIPVHICYVANLFRRYVTLAGEAIECIPLPK